MMVNIPSKSLLLSTSLQERVEETVAVNVLGIDFTFFAVSDMQKSLTFYRDLLGIPLACLVHEGTWAEFEII